MRNYWNLFIVCFLCILCFQPYRVNAQVQSQKKITIVFITIEQPKLIRNIRV